MITPKLTINFHKYMARKYKFKIVKKSDSDMMKVIAIFLSYLVSIKPEDFMKKFSTTIWDRVYVPYEIGKGNRSQLFRQICTITHESRHVYDFRKNSITPLLYLGDKTKRTEMEFKAISTCLYLYWWRYERLPNIWEKVSILTKYGLDKTDIKVAYKCLLMQTPIVKKDKIANSVAKTAIRWLKRYAKNI